MNINLNFNSVYEILPPPSKTAPFLKPIIYLITAVAIGILIYKCYEKKCRDAMKPTEGTIAATPIGHSPKLVAETPKKEIEHIETPPPFDDLEIRKSDEENFILKGDIPPAESILQSFRTKYLNYSSEQKAALRSRANEVLLSNFYCGSSYDFVDSKIIQRKIYDFSIQLFQGNFKNRLVFAIGQSPAWFLATAQLHDPHPERLRSVAFSGDWYGLFNTEGDELLFDYSGRTIERHEGYTYIKKIEKGSKLMIIPKNEPTPEQLKNYRSYLSRIVGCTPQNIMAQSEPTVIVDYIQRAGGLKSFLELLFSWGEEEGIERKNLKEKMVIECLYNADADIIEDPDGYLKENLGEYSSECIKLISVTSNEEYSQEDLAICDLFAKSRDPVIEKRRLIKRFPPSQWTAKECQTGSYEKALDFMEAIHGNLARNVPLFVEEDKRNLISV